jgi:hypothetical protein
VHGTVTVLDHGPAENSWCLLIAGDGFTSSQLGSFKTAVDVHVAFLQAHLTGALNWQKINVIRLDVESDESGADNENGGGGLVDTYFDATFGGDAGRSLLVDTTLAIDTANAQFPEWDALLVLVNSTAYGGSGGGGVAVGSLNPSHCNEIALRELGHAAFGLHRHCWHADLACRMRNEGAEFCPVCAARIDSVLAWSSSNNTLGEVFDS